MEYTLSDNSLIRLWSLTDTGMVRDHNEDHFGFFIPDRKQQKEGSGSLLITADGIGGYDNGEVASKMVVDTFIDCFKRYPGKYDRESVGRMMEVTNNKVYEYALSLESKKAGATMSALILKRDRAVVVNSGDCRVYRVRRGKIEQLSKDHSLVQQMIDTGQLDKEEARQQSFKNLVTSAVGVDEKIIFEYNRIILKYGDRFVLCSDGLHGLVTDEEILEITKSGDPEKAATSLVELANQRGGNDNVTVQVVHYNRRQPKAIPFIFGMLMMIVILGMAFLIGPLGREILIDGKPLPWVKVTPSPVVTTSVLKEPRVSFLPGIKTRLIKVYHVTNVDFEQKQELLAYLVKPGGVTMVFPREGEYMFVLYRRGYLPLHVKTGVTLDEPVTLSPGDLWKKRMLTVKVNTRATLTMKRNKTKADSNGMTALTDNGSAVFEGIESGKYFLKVSAQGFMTDTQMITIDGDDENNPADLEVTLKPLAPKKKIRIKSPISKGKKKPKKPKNK